jgi:hypothetical protein
MSTPEPKFSIGDKVTIRPAFFVTLDERRQCNLAVVKRIQIVGPFSESEEEPTHGAWKISYVVAVEGENIDGVKFSVPEDDLEPRADAVRVSAARTRLAAAVLAIDLSIISPITAITKLYELKRIAQEDQKQ